MEMRPNFRSQQKNSVLFIHVPALNVAVINISESPRDILYIHTFSTVSSFMCEWIHDTALNGYMYMSEH